MGVDICPLEVLMHLEETTTASHLWRVPICALQWARNNDDEFQSPQDGLVVGGIARRCRRLTWHLASVDASDDSLETAAPYKGSRYAVAVP
jgi:hypothetical protein